MAFIPIAFIPIAFIPIAFIPIAFIAIAFIAMATVPLAFVQEGSKCGDDGRIQDRDLLACQQRTSLKSRKRSNRFNFASRPFSLPRITSDLSPAPAYFPASTSPICASIGTITSPAMAFFRTWAKSASSAPKAWKNCMSVAKIFPLSETSQIAGSAETA